MDAAPFHHPPAKGQTVGGVVVAADEQNRQIARGQLGEKTVEQVHRLSLGDRAVVHIPRDQHRVGFLPVDDSQNLLYDVLLVFQHWKLVHPLAQM